MAEFEVERVGGELKRFGVEGSDVPFKVVSPYDPAGSQPKAIESLVQGVRDGDRYQVLLGVTGSGKTFTMAKTIEALGKPTLVMAPNKTLAAQLASELKEFFPNNAVVYFVSYYDYYQPEAYVPQSDTYIEKDSSINEEVEMLRHQATASLLSRRELCRQPQSTPKSPKAAGAQRRSCRTTPKSPQAAGAKRRGHRRDQGPQRPRALTSAQRPQPTTAPSQIACSSVTAGGGRA